ncbi:MAG: flagellar motor protein MotB [Bdellovibrionales bacterium]
MSEDESGSSNQPIVIKKIVKGGGHHGGAWKVAYADFVTAMMAFFLLMWLLSMASDEQLDGIADYFSPAVVSLESSGAGGVMGGQSLSVDGARKSDLEPIAPKPEQLDYSTGTEIGQSITQDEIKEQIKEELEEQEQEKMAAIKNTLEEAIAKDPDLAELSENLMVEMTPEGLRIQVIDAEGKPMFASGSARMFERTRKLMDQVGQAILNVPNEISIRGHTDSIPYGVGSDYTNWELSTDRAHSSRRTLENAGVSADRLNNVVGKSDTEHLLPEDPTNAKNRRISIVLLKEELTDPEGYKKRVEELVKKKAATLKEQEINVPNLPSADPTRDGSVTPTIPTPSSDPFNQTDGEVQFP